MHDDPRDEPRPVRVLLDGRQVRRGILMLVVVLVGLQLASATFSALGTLMLDALVAWLIAVSIEPVVAYLHRKGMRRGSATMTVMAFGMLLLASAVALLGAIMSAQIDDLLSGIPAAVDSVSAWVSANTAYELNEDDILAMLPLDEGAVTVVTGAFNGVISALTIAVFTFYLSADMPRLQEWLAGFLPPRRRAVMLDVWAIAVSKAGSYLIGKGVLAAASAAAHSLAFWALDVPYWLPLGLFAGLVSQFIPTIGTYIGALVPAAVAFGHDPATGFWVLAFAVFYQQIENYVFTPRVSRATMDMHPGVALAAVLGGAALLGPLGAIIGIPVVAIALALTDAYVNRYDHDGPDTEQASEDAHDSTGDTHEPDSATD